MNYLFISQDAYLKEKAINELKSKLLKDDFSQFFLERVAKASGYGII